MLVGSTIINLFEKNAYFENIFFWFGRKGQILRKIDRYAFVSVHTNVLLAGFVTRYAWPT